MELHCPSKPLEFPFAFHFINSPDSSSSQMGLDLDLEDERDDELRLNRQGNMLINSFQSFDVTGYLM